MAESPHADPATESHFPLKFTKVLTKGDKTAMGSKRTKTKKFLVRKLGKAENIFKVVAKTVSTALMLGSSRIKWFQFMLDTYRST